MTEGMGIGYPKAERDDIEVRGAGNKIRTMAAFVTEASLGAAWTKAPPTRAWVKKVGIQRFLSYSP